MLDPWIIEEIRKREDLDQRGEEQPVLEIPLEAPGENQTQVQDDDATERGVVIVDFRI